MKLIRETKIEVPVGEDEDLTLYLLPRTPAQEEELALARAGNRYVQVCSELMQQYPLASLSLEASEMQGEDETEEQAEFRENALNQAMEFLKARQAATHEKAFVEGRWELVRVCRNILVRQIARWEGVEDATGNAVPWPDDMKAREALLGVEPLDSNFIETATAKYEEARGERLGKSGRRAGNGTRT